MIQLHKYLISLEHKIIFDKMFNSKEPILQCAAHFMYDQRINKIDVTNPEYLDRLVDKYGADTLEETLIMMHNVLAQQLN